MRELQGEALHKYCVQYTIVGGGGRVHVWNAFHAGGRSQLVILDSNVTGAVNLNIPREDLFPWARQTFADNLCCQDNNTPANRSRILHDCMEQWGCNNAASPSLLPDCHSFEYLWDF